MLQSGTILGNRYEIIQLVGSGGMADVYKSKDHRLNRLVAIKVLKSEFGSDAEFVKRFHVEAQAAAGLLHPNIVTIYDVGEEDGLHYIVMELVEGLTLESYIHKTGKLTPEETVRFSIQIAQGLEAAHSNNTVHRDIKPQNIIVTKEGRIKVTDFGIARASNANTITMATIGSVHYFSPEQARGGYVDTRSDIYSLGITMYEMVTGHVPFDGENPVAVALKHLQEEVIPPSQIVPQTPKSLEKIILKSVSKKPEYRYSTVAELVEDLKKVFSQTDGSYVNVSSVTGGVDSPTIVMSGDDVDKIKKMTGGYDKTYVRKAQKEEVAEESTDGSPFSNPDEMNPKLEKLIFGLTIVVGIIFAIIFIAFIVKTVGNSSTNGSVETTTTEEIASSTTTAEDDTTKETASVTMPNVVGENQQEAVNILTKANLKAAIQTEVSDDVEKDKVIRQSVPYGYDLEEGSTVTIVVSTGKEQAEVPDVTGKKESSAKSSLDKAGFKIKTQEEYSDSVAEGRVIEQSPQGGKNADYGSTVTLTISKGPETKEVKVPSLVGKSYSEAKSLLKNQGLSVGNAVKEYSDTYSEGTVISQSPDGGTTVEEGTSVDLVVSRGAEPKSYRYPGQVTVDCPFDDGVEEGSVSLVLSQNGQTKTIFNKNVHSTDFPLSVSFEGYAEGSATVILYWDGNKAGSYNVTLEKVEE
ncbi:MAG: Stk1 family PASTA domain-containing Ser/Thr kinase [Lachnospiraceae bacterium]|nr:Stk1 family PASTA domain-containing Ser/Thr kinase [Lachnospiraceae bacterium]